MQYTNFFGQLFLICFDDDDFGAVLQTVRVYYPNKPYEEIREIFADYMVWGTEHQYFNVVKVDKGYPVFPGSLKELKERVVKDFISKKAYEAKDYWDFWYTPYCMLGRGIVEDYPIGRRNGLVLKKQLTVTANKTALLTVFEIAYKQKVSAVKDFFQIISDVFSTYSDFEKAKFKLELLDIGMGLMILNTYGSNNKWEEPFPEQATLTKRLWMHLELYGEIPNDLLEHWGYPYLQWLTEAPPSALILHPTVGLYQEA